MIFGMTTNNKDGGVPGPIIKFLVSNWKWLIPAFASAVVAVTTVQFQLRADTERGIDHEARIKSIELYVARQNEVNENISNMADDIKSINKYLRGAHYGR